MDGCGSMLLSNLMRSWGEEEGLLPRKILDALEINQRQADGGVRFSVDRLGDDWEITVHPRHSHFGDRGDRCRPRPRAHSTDMPTGTGHLDNFSTKDKMSMGLDDIIAGPDGGGACGSSSRDHYRSDRDRARADLGNNRPDLGPQLPRAAGDCKAEIIDLEDENFDLASLAPAVQVAPHPRSFASTGWARRRVMDERERMDHPREGPYERIERPRDAPRDRTNSHHQDHEHKVKLSKFVSYILKRGHAELGIDLWQDFADCNDLVRILNQKRTFGEYTLQELKNTLQDSDDVGRFHFWKDWVKKVDRSDRDAAKSSSAPTGMEMDNAQGAGHPGRAPSFNASRPLPPPGVNWTQYTDEGQGKTWWFYDGPLGKWWCDDDDAEPKVWNFDD